MKKVAIIIVTVAALIGLTIYADRATRLSSKPLAASKPTADAPAKPAPEIKLKDLNDKDIALADYKGKVVLVNFGPPGATPAV